jgi:alkyl hydroperoxide reductase subunit AhpC
VNLWEITLSCSSSRSLSREFMFFENVLCLIWVTKRYACPTELVAMSDRHDEFRKLNTAVVAISVDSAEALLAWSKISRREGGLGGPLNIP